MFVKKRVLEIRQNANYLWVYVAYIANRHNIKVSTYIYFINVRSFATCIQYPYYKGKVKDPVIDLENSVVENPEDTLMTIYICKKNQTTLDFELDFIIFISFTYYLLVCFPVKVVKYHLKRKDNEG